MPATFSREYGAETPSTPGIEPSSSPRKPEVTESIERKQYYDSYYLAEPDSPAHRPARDGSRSVSFWNLSGKRVMLQIAGKQHVLDRGQHVTLDLPTSFTWQLDARPAEQTAFEEDRAAMEIVLRK